jgi:DNA polymerase
MEAAFTGAYLTKKRQRVGVVYFESDDVSVRIILPSGRAIHYLNPHAYFDGHGYKISFDGQRQTGWGRQTTWGGRLTENVVQAVARDVLAEGMLRAERKGLNIVLHCHDEIVCEESISGPKVEDLELLMSAPIDWAPGLPLAAEGFETEFYGKG